MENGWGPASTAAMAGDTCFRDREKSHMIEIQSEIKNRDSHTLGGYPIR